jgi:hypothetical protein
MAINPTPNVPAPVFSLSTSGIKPATPDLFTTSKVDDIGILEDLLFESVAGQELLNFSRYDTVNGQNVAYRPIKNVSSLAIQYSPQNLLSLQNPSTAYFNNFPIKLETKVPTTGELSDIIYIESETGDLIINCINMDADEQVEVEILTSGSVLDDTIY